MANGLAMMLFAWIGWLGGYGVDMIHMVASIYHGYAPTLMGGFMGGAWGFLDGYIFGLVIALFYNLCLCCPCCRKSGSCESK